jgi:hypothetical protein
VWDFPSLPLHFRQILSFLLHYVSTFPRHLLFLTCLLFRNSELEITNEIMFLNLVPNICYSKQTFLPVCFQETVIGKRRF